MKPSAVYCVTVFLILGYVAIAEETNNSAAFVATDEWQTIAEGKMIRFFGVKT
jgi:hypothetical protein